MKFAIGLIAWPEDSRAANVLLKCFMLKALSLSGVDLSDDEVSPEHEMRKYLDGEVSAAHCRKLAVDYLAKLSPIERVREFRDRSIVKVRLANSLLDVDESGGMSYEDELGWFLELLGFYGVDYYGVVRPMMIEYFSPYVAE